MRRLSLPSTRLILSPWAQGEAFLGSCRCGCAGVAHHMFVVAAALLHKQNGSLRLVK